jgi:O-antigen/teichoic acid export membrane protein
MTDLKPIGPSAYTLWPVLRNAMTASFWPILDQAMVSGSNFLTNVVIARELGVYDFGIFTLAWSTVLLGLSLQLSVISLPMYTLAGKVREHDTAGYYGALVLFEAIFTAIVFLGAYAGSRGGGMFFKGWPFTQHALPLAMVAICYLWQDFVRRCLFSRGRTIAAFAIDVVSYPVQLIALALAAFHGLTLNGALWIIGGTSIASAVLGLAGLFPLRVTLADMHKAAIDHWNFARWIVGSIATNWVVLNIFYVAAGIALGATAVASLRASVLLFAIGNVFFLGLENFVPVRGAQLLARNGMPALLKYMNFWLVIGISVSVGISLCVAVLASFWLRLAFGDAFTGHAGIAYVLSVMYPLSCYVSLGGILLRCASVTRTIFLIWAAMAAVGLVVAYPLVQWLGVYGAAGGQLACYVVGCWLTRRSIRQLTGQSLGAA